MGSPVEDVYVSKREPIVDTGPSVAESEEYADFDSKKILNDTIEHFTETALKQYQMEPNEANFGKIMNKLTAKILNEITSGDLIMNDVSDKHIAKKYFELACERRGIENTSANWKKIIQSLKENI